MDALCLPNLMQYSRKFGKSTDVNLWHKLSNSSKLSLVFASDYTRPQCKWSWGRGWGSHCLFLNYNVPKLCRSLIDDDETILYEVSEYAENSCVDKH